MPRKSHASPPTGAAGQRSPADIAWFDEQLLRVGLTRGELAARVGTHPNAISRILAPEGTGNTRKPRVEELIVLADVLRVPLGLLLQHLGYNYTAPRGRLIGSANAVGRVALAPDPLPLVWSPTDLLSDVACVVAREPIPALALLSQAQLFFQWPADQTGAAISGLGVNALCVVKTTRAAVRLARVSVEGDHVDARSIDGEPLTDTLLLVQPIRWIRP